MKENIMDRKKTIELTEVRKDQTGYGLLIENDGHIIGNDDTVSQIKEDIAHHDKFVIPDRFTVNAVFQKYGIKNANGRIYPEDILKREVENYIRKKVMSRSAIGALDHPDSSTLSGKDVSHNITNLEWKGRTLVGQMDLHLSQGFRRYGICSTSGDYVANLIIDNILIGVSSRAVGSVEDKMGVLIVGDDLELIGWDVVCEPSTPNAYISKDLSSLEKFIENKETDNEKLIVNEKLARIKSILYL